MRINKIALLIAMSGIVFAAHAAAATFSFSDEELTWPSWSGTNHTGTDSVGTPNFLGGYGEVSNGLLKSISFQYTQTSYAHNAGVPLAAGALFIDADADFNWDYVVDTLLEDSNTASNQSLYKVNIAERASDAYILSQNSVTWPSGTSIRKEHPVGIDVDGQELAGSVVFSGWFEGQNSSNNPHVSIFTFNTNIILGDYFIVSWMPNCANDIVYKEIGRPGDGYVPAPEPGTLLLLGLGLAGLAGYARLARRR